MSDRRTLVEGMKATPPPIDAGKEKDFVYGEKPKPPHAATPTTATVVRVPFSTRIRKEFSEALKRASLERQLKGIEPNSLQDILEQAIEPWLKSNGYIS